MIRKSVGAGGGDPERSGRTALSRVRARALGRRNRFAGGPDLGLLRVRRDFTRVAARGRKAALPGLVLQALVRTPHSANAQALPPSGIRVGLTASRKVGGAVARNRARRRLRAVAKVVLASHARVDTDYVLIARKATPGRPYAELLDDLQTALKRLNAWRDGEESSQRRRGKAAPGKAAPDMAPAGANDGGGRLCGRD